MKKLVLILVALSFAGCGKDNLDRVVETQTNTVQLPAVVVDQVNQVISEENAYRLAAGQAPLTSGLTCTLHNLIATQPASIPASPPAAVATFVYVGSFNQADSAASSGLNILPAALKATYSQWFLVKCQGQIVVTDSRYELFNLTSDDGSNLYLDGALLVNNDGNHGAQLRSGSKLLKRGIHTFRLDYMQGPAGNQALILEDSFGVIPGTKFYR